MVLDRQAKHQLVQALLRARDRRGSVDVLEDAAQTHAYAKGTPPNGTGWSHDLAASRRER